MCEGMHLPCPFCGEDDGLEAYDFGSYEMDDGKLVRTSRRYAVRCWWCGARGPSGDTAEDAWFGWDHGIHGEREDYAEAYRRVGEVVYMERLKREGLIDG